MAGTDTPDSVAAGSPIDGSGGGPPASDEAPASARRASGGRPLPPSVRSFFTPRIGQDLGHVRVHTGERAEALSRALGARAVTYGSDIFFRDGSYRPETPGGARLLAHELTHVTQQRALREPTLLRTPDPDAQATGFRVVRLPDGDLFVEDTWQRDDEPSVFKRRVLNKYVRWRFGQISNAVHDRLIRRLESAPSTTADITPVAGDQVGVSIERSLERDLVRIYTRSRKEESAAPPTDDPSSESGNRSTAEPSTATPPAGPEPATEGPASEEPPPPEVREFFENARQKGGSRLTTEEATRLYRLWDRFVEGRPTWGEEGESFVEWMRFFEENSDRLRGRLEASEEGQLELDVLKRLTEKLERGQRLEFPDKEERSLAERAREARPRGSDEGEISAEWLLLPVEDRKLLLEVMEKHPELFEEANGGVRALTAGAKRGMALRISVKYLPDEVGRALADLATDPGFWLTTAGIIALYVGLWLAPDVTVTKVAAAALTAFLLAYVGWDAITTFARAWSRLSETCRTDARTGEELEGAARTFAADLGPVGATVLLLIAFWVVGRGAGRALRGRKGSTSKSGSEATGEGATGVGEPGLVPEPPAPVQTPVSPRTQARPTRGQSTTGGGNRRASVEEVARRAEGGERGPRAHTRERPRSRRRQKREAKRSLTQIQRDILKEVRNILRSSKLERLQEGHRTGTHVEVEVNGRPITYEPGMRDPGFTNFEAGGFHLGRHAFSSRMELIKTLIHEITRLRTSRSQVEGVSGTLAAEETSAAWRSADELYDIGVLLGFW